MEADLLINRKDAYSTWGVRMGDGFLDALNAPVSMKEYIENSSRMEHGKRVVAVNAKVASREITLPFTIQGTSEADFRSKRDAFYSELYKGDITISVPQDSPKVYHLLYTGKSITYAQTRDRKFAKFSARFEEPNPMNRDD